MMKKTFKNLAIVVALALGSLGSTAGTNLPAPAADVTGGADVVVTSVTLVPATPNLNETFDVVITIRNQGDVATDSIVYFDIYIDRDPTVGIDPDGCVTIPRQQWLGNINDQLDPGQSSTRTITKVGGLGPGSHKIWAYADASCISPEVNELNNSNTPITLNIGSLPSGPTDITVDIAGINRGTYSMVPDTSQIVKYPLDGGPVVIHSNNGVGIIASLDQWRRLSGADPWTGIAQSMAIPIELITNKYVMPRYVGDDPTLYNAILMANVDTVSRTINVTIGGTAINDTITLGASQSQFLVYNGVVGGPIVVSSANGAKIVASLYELKRGSSNTTYNGQSEMNGLPFSQLSDTYLIPIYFGDPSHVGLNARLFIANADTVSVDISVKIGGVPKGTYTLLPNTSQVLKYPVDGAVEVSSPAGSKIIASLDQWRRLSAADPWTGIAQSMAIPVEVITNTYVMPHYINNDPTLYNAILTANVDTVSRDINVKIGGTAINDTITLGPSESKYLVYNGVTGGPIVVSSDLGAKIVASLYELKRGTSGTTYNGQSEMNGLPLNQISDTYLIPIYFGDPSHVGLNARLFIAVP